MKITHLTLYTNSLSATKEFYTTTLQLPLLDIQPNSITLQAGDTTLTFIETKEVVNVYHFAFNIPSNKLQEALNWGKENLSLIENISGNLVTTFENWHAESIYFTDNNGSILEFIARKDMNIISEETFSPKDILNISEIGIVTADPIQQAEKLIKQYGLNYFKKAPPTPQFLALGDDEGLLIFVVPNRNWYPTTIEAKPTSATIVIEHEQKLAILQQYSNVENERLEFKQHSETPKDY